VTSLAYRDPDGGRHEVLVRQTPTGDWQVLDTCCAETRVVETLDGREDGCPQARRSRGTTSPPRSASCRRRGESPATPYLSKRGADASCARRRPTVRAIPEQAGSRYQQRSPAALRSAPSRRREGLRCRIRLAVGRILAGQLEPERHRALQIGMLHRHSGRLVQFAAAARCEERLQITTRPTARALPARRGVR
jgi:hypothetical protein